MDAKREIRSLSGEVCGLEIRQSGKGPPTLIGYPIVANAMSDPINGQFREIVHPDAIRSAMGRKPDVRALIDHDPGKVLGRTTAGTLTLVPDERGLRFECQLPNTSYAADLAESVRRGDVSGMSFGFDARRDSWQDQVLPGGKRTSVRTLHDLDLHDVSVVTFPAYPDANVALRSLERHRESVTRPQDRILREYDTRFGKLAHDGGGAAGRSAEQLSAAAHKLSGQANDPASHAQAADGHDRAKHAHHEAADQSERLADYHRSLARGHAASADMHNAKAKG
jgi:HK97 family phage prohead protease